MRIESLDLNLIVALEAIVRLRSVSAAARELNLTQPALSRALARLRDHFGDELVTPIGRRMAPTEFGARLVSVAADLLNETRAFAQLRPGFDPETAAREFAIGASDYVCAVFLTRVVRDLAAAAPGVTIRIVPADDVVDQDMIERGDVDFVVLPRMILNPDQPYAALFEDTFVCAVWSGNQEVGETLDLDAYMRLRHVTTALGPAGRQSHFERFLSDTGRVVPTALSLPNLTQLPEFLIGTPYVATIHRRLADRLPEGAPLRILPPPIAIPPLAEHLQWHRAREPDAASAWLRRRMKRIAADM